MLTVEFGPRDLKLCMSYVIIVNDLSKIFNSVTQVSLFFYLVTKIYYSVSS